MVHLKYILTFDFFFQSTYNLGLKNDFYKEQMVVWNVSDAYINIGIVPT